jgi:hypothetical protein
MECYRVPIIIFILAVTCARIIYTGWYSPLFHLQMRGDGMVAIFGGIDGYFLAGPLRPDLDRIAFHYPYISVLFFHSIFHSLCSTKYLSIVLIVTAHTVAVSIILLSVRIFYLSHKRKMFQLLMFVIIFNWTPFYDGITQGMPPEFIEVLFIFLGFSLMLAGSVRLAGIAFGIASTIKILTIVFLLYFLYKRQYKLVVTAVITCIILCIFILLKENISWITVNNIFDVIERDAPHGINARDSGLSAFIHFVFHRSLGPDLLKNIHYASCILLALFFCFIERYILSENHKYLFGFAVASMAIFHLSPHTSEMYWWILLLPAIIFNIWMLLKFKDILYGITFGLAYIFLHGFSLIIILFRVFSLIAKDGFTHTGMYNSFNLHGGAFIGVWLLYFSTFGLTLKYLVSYEREVK